MAPQLTEDEADDLIYFARAGEEKELQGTLTSLANREAVPAAEILATVRDEGKSTCLHMATGNGHLEIIKVVLEVLASWPKESKQAFLDAQNEYGNTALHWAALGGHLDIVRLLVENGASPALANDRNYVPLDLAGLNDHVAVVDFFLAQSKGLESQNMDSGGLDAEVGDIGLEGGETVEGEQEKES